MKSEPLQITKDNPLKVFLTFSIPSVLGLLAVSSAETVDAIFVGNYAGASSLAAINMVMPFFYFVFGFGVMIISGSGVRCGKYKGEGKDQAASAIFTRTVIVLAIICIIITFAGTVLSEQLVGLLGANKDLTAESSLYLRTISFFTLFFLGSFALSVFVRVDGRPVFSSVGMIAGAACNLVLDYWLVAHLGMGLKGAALATGGSQIVSFIIQLSHFISAKSNLRFELNQGRWSELWKACYNGLSELTNEISAGIVVLIFNWIMISRMGVSGVAAFSVINYTLGFGIMISYGISDSILPIISTNYGAGHPERIRSFLIISGSHIFGLGVTLFSLLAYFPEQMIDVFLESDELATAKIALEFTGAMKWVFLFVGLNMIFSAYHTAMHRPMESAAIALLRSLILPVSALVLLPTILGDPGIYFALPLAEFITLMIALVMFIKNRPSILMKRLFQTDPILPDSA
jgi:MATE family, multidrug efflux pump